ncbi:hypothetical protein BDQ17DRAFT_1435640 [Cyathus striatus]|nr:hypothetical protein BDQ17DRAFT_1435640 [Cyathus striatus]
MAWTTEDQVRCERYADALLDFIEHMNDVHPPRHPGNPPSEYDYYVKHRNPWAPHPARISYPPPRTSSVPAASTAPSSLDNIVLPTHGLELILQAQARTMESFFAMHKEERDFFRQSSQRSNNWHSQKPYKRYDRYTRGHNDFRNDNRGDNRNIERAPKLADRIERGRDATPQPTGLTDQKEWARNKGGKQRRSTPEASPKPVITKVKGSPKSVKAKATDSSDRDKDMDDYLADEVVDLVGSDLEEELNAAASNQDMPGVMNSYNADT